MSDDAGTGKDSTKKTTWLFSFGASSVKTRPTRDGLVAFRINADDCSVITAFTDHPNRITAQMRMERFAREFGDMFDQQKPSASLTYWDKKGNLRNHVYEINTIKTIKNKYIIKAELIKGDYIDLADNNSKKRLKSKCVEQKAITNANFFMDGSHYSGSAALLIARLLTSEKLF